MGTLPQNNFVDVSDGKNGVAFLSNSLTEYEVLENEERTVALSLLRAVCNWICTETRVGSDFPSQKGGQCLGFHELHYAIRPHAGDWQGANIPLAADLFNAPQRLVQTRINKGTLPAKKASLFEIDNPLVRCSAIKKAEDRDTWVVRLYNPTGETQRARVRFHAPLAKAWETNLNEKRLEALKVTKSNAVAIAVGPRKIMTIEVKTDL
jgi:mannosylglycerate hydrolase